MNKETLAQQEQNSLDVIKRRIKEKTNSLKDSIQLLNNERNAEYKSSELTLLKTLNIKTDLTSNIVDMVKVNDNIIIGYKVPKNGSQTLLANNVLSSFKLISNENASLEECPLNESPIYSNKFEADVNNLLKFYTNAEILQFVKTESNLFISFKIGPKESDLKVFYWDVVGNSFVYKGEYSGTSLFSNISKLEFSWKELGRDRFVSGDCPLVNINDSIFVGNTNGFIRIKNKPTTNNAEKDIILKKELKDSRQSLENASFAYHQVESLFLIKVQPYKESAYYFIVDTITDTAIEADGLGYSGVMLPENAGIIYSNGYYLKDGGFKKYDHLDNAAYHYETVKSPNGEDYMYVFYSLKNNTYYLYNYSIVSKEIDAPIIANGYVSFDNGSLLISKNDEKNAYGKIHDIQVWKTSFYSDEYYSSLVKKTVENRISKIGNSELVKAIGSLNTIVNFIHNKEVSVSVYDSIIAMIDQANDGYHWLKEFSDLKIVEKLKEVKESAYLVIQEFKKVEELKSFAEQKINKVEKDFSSLNNETYIKNDDLAHLMQLIIKINAFIGELSSIKNERYIDVSKINTLNDKAEERRVFVNNKIVELLAQDKTYNELEKSIENTQKEIEKESKYKPLKEINAGIDKLAEQLSVINQEIGTLEFQDTTMLANILEKVATIFAKLNQVKAKGKQKEKDLAFNEAKIEFASHSKLLEQSFKNALNNAHNIEATDAEYANILSVLEGIEARFAEFDTEEFIEQLSKQRESIQTAFETHRQQLQAVLQKKVDNLSKAIEVSLKSITSKASKIDNLKTLSAFFLTDGMVLRVKNLISDIKTLGDINKSEEFATRLKNTEVSFVKKVRDDQDIFENNGTVLKLGNHRFAVNKQNFEIVLVRKNEELFTHIQGTQFYRKVSTENMNPDLYKYWDYELISESKDLYRSEYLVYSIFEDAKNNNNGLSDVVLKELMDKGTRNGKPISILTFIQEYSSNLYKEGYIKGIHDNDAAALFSAIYKEKEKVQEFNFLSKDRLTAYIIKSCGVKDNIVKDIKNGLSLLERIKSSQLLDKTMLQLENDLNTSNRFNNEVLDYLVNHIKNKGATSTQVVKFYDEMISVLNPFIEDMIKSLNSNDTDFKEKNSIIEDLRMIFKAYCETDGKPVSLIEETLIYIMQKTVHGEGNIDAKDVDYLLTVSGLYGDHPLIKDGKMSFIVEDFMIKNDYHRKVVMPIYEGVDKFKHDSLNEEKSRININDFIAKPLSSFIKNRLISESYFPKIGTNLAKQIGETGDKKKTDTMGMLLLISPPGYGKTTLIEYIVNKLGMIFVKVNCPSIGHDVTSLDPEKAPNLTARKEIEKINLAFEMGSNVFLYLDDIQHTNSEFLQKFISLCDGTRTIDGVWEGKSKTYNLRNKRIAVAMAGNPYTESGEVFKIPDMLANRADTYNLGEILSDDREVFELSYIENAIVSNAITSPLANRSMNDMNLVIKMADGIEVDKNDFEHQYSPTELTEIVKIIKMMRQIQKVVLKVNQNYISSASQNNDYRNEPPFKLQGSYRNMAKIVERLVPVMNEAEVDALIMDHYQAESQTLTSSNEENLLKFKEITNRLSPDEAIRWEELKDLYKKGKTSEDDLSLERIANVLEEIKEKM